VSVSENRSRDLRKYERSRIEPEGESFELPNDASVTEPEVMSEGRMDRDMKVSVFQIQAGEPLPSFESPENGTRGLHLEGWAPYVSVQCREVYNGSPFPRGLWHQKNSAVKAWGRNRSDLYGSFVLHLKHCQMQSLSLSLVAICHLGKGGHRERR